MIYASFFSLLVFGSSDGPIDGPTLERLLDAEHAKIKTIAFLCEGTIANPTPQAQSSKQIQVVRSEYMFQSKYAFRRKDKSCMLDTYCKDETGRYEVRQIYTIRNDVLNVYTQDPRSPQWIMARRNGLPIKPDVVRPTDPTGLKVGSPERIHWLHYFRGRHDDIKDTYRFLGWEKIDDRRCVVVAYDENPRLEPRFKSLSRYWIDLERGGHPLKVEVYEYGGGLVLKFDQIRLQEFVAADSTKVWFPVQGEVKSYKTRDLKVAKNPQYIEKYFIVPSSVLVNAPLPDKFFSIVDIATQNLSPETAEIRRLRQEFESKLKNAKLSRTDPVSVQTRLDAELAIADAQQRQLDASAPSEWNPTIPYQIGLIGLGAAVLTAALCLRRKTA